MQGPTHQRVSRLLAFKCMPTNVAVRCFHISPPVPRLTFALGLFRHVAKAMHLSLVLGVIEIVRKCFTAIGTFVGVLLFMHDLNVLIQDVSSGEGLATNMTRG